MGKCLVALAAGGQQQRDACAQEVTAGGQRLSTDRGCRDLRKQLIPAPPPVKSFSKQTPGSHSPHGCRANPEGLRNGNSFGEQVGKAGLGNGSLSLGERELGQVGELCFRPCINPPQDRSCQSGMSTESLCSCRTKLVQPSALTIQQLLLHEGKASHLPSVQISVTPAQEMPS